MIRVLMACSSELAFIGFRSLIDAISDIEPLGHAANPAALVNVVVDRAPDVILLDGHSPRLAANLELISAIHPDSTTMPGVLLMAASLDSHLFDTLRFGVRGITVEPYKPDELAAAIRAIGHGGLYFSESACQYIIGQLLAARAPAVYTSLAAITCREAEVLDLVADGMSNDEIGAYLHISEPTVKYHISHLLRKLSRRDRLQLAVFAWRQRLASVAPTEKPGVACH